MKRIQYPILFLVLVFFTSSTITAQEQDDFTRLRQRMVRWQIIARGVKDPKVIRAMEKVPRHLFVSEALRDQAYGDFPLPIGDQQTISQCRQNSLIRYAAGFNLDSNHLLALTLKFYGFLFHS